MPCLTEDVEEEAILVYLSGNVTRHCTSVGTTVFAWQYATFPGLSNQWKLE